MLNRRDDKTKHRTISNDCIYQTLLSCVVALGGVFCPQREIERMSDGRNTNSILYQSKMDVYPSNLSHNCKICYMKCEIMEICDAKVDMVIWFIFVNSITLWRTNTTLKLVQ